MTEPSQYPSGPGGTPPPGQPSARGYGAEYGSRYGGFGAFDEPAESAPRRSRKPYVIGGTLVLVLALGGGGAWLYSATSETVFSRHALESEVADVLRDNYGERAEGDVSCPDDESAEAGHEFTCTVKLSGDRKTVGVRVRDDEKTFTVGAPQ